MNSKVIMALAAAAAFASCAKNEVVPVTAPEQEISYQTVTGPNTKADVAYKTENVFVSYAYRLEGAGSTWAADKDQAILYIDGEVIRHYDGEGTSGVWKASNGNHYYWPDNGNLTFFAWSTNRTTCKLETNGGNVACDKENGIYATGYDASLNKNYDFMVADKKENMTANESDYGYTGVPTLFRHKMCQVKYSVRTNVTYPKTNFWIDNLELKNIYQEGDYSQNHDGWDFTGKNADKSYKYSSAQNSTELKETIYPLESHWVEATCVDQFYFIPQIFNSESEDQVLRIEYTIKTGNAAETKYYAEKKLSEIFPEGWKKNMKYNVDIILGLNEVLWAPGVADWETGTVVDGGWSLIGGGTAVNS